MTCKLTWLGPAGLLVMIAVALILAPGSAGGDYAAAQANQVLLGPKYGKTFETVAEAPKQACQQLSGPLGQMEWSDRKANGDGLLSLGLVAKTGAIPFTISGAADCTWVTVGSDFEVTASDSYDVKFVMDVSGAVVLNGLTSVGCDAERAGAQLFAFLWDQETGEVIASKPVPLPEAEKPTIDHNGCSAQEPVTGLFSDLAETVRKVAKTVKLGDDTIPLKDAGHTEDMFAAEGFLGKLSSWPAVQKFSKEGYEFALDGPVQLESGKSYGVAVGLFGFALSLASAATGAGYATVLFEAGSYELYDWPTNFKIEVGPTRLTAIQILPEGTEAATATPSLTRTPASRSPTPSASSTPAADLFVTKLDSPDPAVSGEEITYTLLVVNSGSAAATDARVDDQLPAGTTFVSSSPDCTEGAKVSCDIGTLAPGDTATFRITVKAPSVTLQTSIKNCAVAYAHNDRNTDNNDHCQWTSINPSSTEETPTPEATPGSPTPEATPASPTPAPTTPASPSPEPTPTCLAAPSNLTANMHWSGGVAWVDLAWSDNSGDEFGFRVERATSVGGPYAAVAVRGPNETAWTDYTPEFGPDSYFYRVVAYSQQCDSLPSNVATVSGRWPTPTPAPVCADITAPSGLIVAREYPSDGHWLIDLQWQDNSGNELGFAVERAIEPEGPWGYVASLGPDSSGSTDEPPAGPSFWYYRVVALGVGPCYSEPSNVAIASGQ